MRVLFTVWTIPIPVLWVGTTLELRCSLRQMYRKLASVVADKFVANLEAAFASVPRKKKGEPAESVRLTRPQHTTIHSAHQIGRTRWE